MNKSLKKLIKLYNITKELRKKLDNHKDQHYIENLEKASQKYAHNWFNMHDMNNYKALKQGFEAGSKWQADQDKKEIERLKGERGWISVKDRLPENEQVVDIWKYDSYRDEYYRVTNHKYEDRYIIEFSHWMPLPEPPKQ